jgi:hypothetical protein
LNPATGSYEPLQNQPPPPAPTFLNPATGSYEPLQGQAANLAQAAETNVGKLNTAHDPGTQGGELACADAVCNIVHDQMGINLPKTLSTKELYENMVKGGWQEVDPHTPGAVIVSPATDTTHGHAGIVGQGGKIYSNSSQTGLWEQNYTVDSWTQNPRFASLGVHAFVPPYNAGSSDQPVARFVPDTSGSTRMNAVFNNPGALGLAPWQSKYGAVASGKYDTGHPFAQFPTKEAGGAAQFDLWLRDPKFVGQPLKQAITNWIGPGEHGEAEFISQKIGMPLDQVITEDFLKGPQGIQLMQAQAEYEGQNVLSQSQWQSAQDWAYKGVAPGSVASQ